MRILEALALAGLHLFYGAHSNHGGESCRTLRNALRASKRELMVAWIRLVEVVSGQNRASFRVEQAVCG